MDQEFDFRKGKAEVFPVRELFQEVFAEYSLAYLMIMAQDYQESQLDQSARSPVGAVGIMQVIPKYAAAKRAI